EEGLNLHQVLAHIGQDGVHDLWVEAGGKCFSAFMKNKLLNQAYIYIAPKWIEPGKPAFEAFHIDSQKFRWEQAGNDVFLKIHW
ncbi:MAG TPA: dihydrofolate reductase family protein, partial [Gammaproteobacteria bacterium]|nr:dihydrofolate reductase family protein [Gammaproteobacteria bacterium]